MATGKAEARLVRQFAWIGKRFPAAHGTLTWVRRPSARLVRLPAALLLIVGGVFSFLPILGLWMLPLGLLLLAVDVPALERPVGNSIVRLRHHASSAARRRRQRKGGSGGWTKVTRQ